MSQLEQFKTVVNGESVWLSGSPMLIMLGLVVYPVVFLPKVTKAVPASLVAIIVVLIGFRLGIYIAP
jgi:SulP family sulfate permease